MSDNVPSVRPSGAVRDQVVELLSRHFVEDTITQDELESRLQRVYAAGTREELESVLADLPSLDEKSNVPATTGGGNVPAQRVETRRIVATLSSQERHVAGVMPRDVEVKSRLGSVVLDLRDTTFEPGESTIHVKAFLGNVEVYFPSGVRVESDGHAFLGNFVVSGGARGGHDVPVVRVTGRAFLGNVECHAQKEGGS